MIVDDHRIDRVSRAMAGPLSRRKMLKLVGGTVAGSAAVAAGVNLKSASAQVPQNVIPIEFENALGSFVGQFEVTRFTRTRDGGFAASGILTGQVFDALGNLVGAVSEALTLPVLSATGACEILTLVLGPLDLTLLGLRIQLNQVVLEITAIPGGGLLGDLLCAISDLLNGGLGTTLNRLVGLLNRLLGAL